MSKKNRFKDEFENWKSELSDVQQKQVFFGHYDSSIDVLFLERSENFDRDLIESLEKKVRAENEGSRVSTYTMPPENKIRDDI